MDRLLTQAHQLYLDQHCPCGCGHRADDCLNPETEGRWEIVLRQSQSQAAVEAFRKEHGENLEPGALVSARLLPPGEVPVDPMEGGGFDPAKALAEHEALRRRLADQEASLT